MRDRRNYLILIGLIVAAVVGAVLLIVPGSPAHKKAHLGLDLPDFAVGADVDIPAREPVVTIPPVLLNSHLTNLRADIDTFARGRRVNLFRRQGWTGCPIRWISALRLA